MDATATTCACASLSEFLLATTPVSDIAQLHCSSRCYKRTYFSALASGVRPVWPTQSAGEGGTSVRDCGGGPSLHQTRSIQHAHWPLLGAPGGGPSEINTQSCTSALSWVARVLPRKSAGAARRCPAVAFLVTPPGEHRVRIHTLNLDFLFHSTRCCTLFSDTLDTGPSSTPIAPLIRRR